MNHSYINVDLLKKTCKVGNCMTGGAASTVEPGISHPVAAIANFASFFFQKVNIDVRVVHKIVTGGKKKQEVVVSDSKTTALWEDDVDTAALLFHHLA